MQAHILTALIAKVRRMGDFLPARYLTEQQGDAASSSYRMRPQSGKGPLVVTAIELPGDDAFVRIKGGTVDYTPLGQAYGPHILDKISDGDEGRLPAPIVLNPNSQLTVEATRTGASDLKTASGLIVSGFHTDVETAAWIRELGECFALSLDTGAVGSSGPVSPAPRAVFDRHVRITHLLEELDVGGEAGAREPARVDVLLGNHRLHPNGDAFALFGRTPWSPFASCELDAANETPVHLEVDFDSGAGDSRFTLTVCGSSNYSTRRR